MKLFFIALVGTLLIAVQTLQAQVNFSARPSSMQVYPRSANDSAIVSIAGQVTSAGFTSAIFTMHKNGVLMDSTVSPLSYAGNNAPFAQNYGIHAEKIHYRFKLYLYDGINSTLLLRADSVCSGDAYIVYGQSNAVAVANGSGTESPYLWVRSFGTQSNVDVTCQADTTWGTGNGSNGNNHGSIGIWSIRLGKMLADTSGIPVCIINGSRSAARIAELVPSSNHLDLTTYYGRLLYRVQKSGIGNKVKALFWYQGESDTDTAYLQYANRFGQLYSGLKQDIPSLTKIIITQIRPGCLINQNTLYHQQLREIQRTIPASYTDVSLATTVGLPNFDGCHFYTVGYQQFAAQLYNQFADDFIGKPLVPESDPPALLSVAYSNNSNTEITLTFDQNILWPATFNGYDMKDYLYLNSSTTFLSGASVGNTVTLQLSASSNATKISYLPAYYYSGVNSEYQGPWLLNNKGVGTAAFYQFPINNSLVINADRPTAICPSDSVILSTSKTGQSYQWYLDGNLISGATSQQFVAKTAGSYTLTVKDIDNLTISSNAIIITYGNGTKPVITSSTSRSIFCVGSSITLTSDIGASWLWNTGETTSSILVSAPGNYAVGVTTSSGCAGVSDTFRVSLDVPAKPIIISNKSGICPGDSIQLSVNTSPVVAWSNGSTQPVIYIADGNSYAVTVSDSIGCPSTSDPVSYVIHPLPDAFINATALHACPGQTITLSSANGGSLFLWSTGQTTSSINVTSSGEFNLTVTDQYGCVGTSPSVQTFIAPAVVSNAPSGTKLLCSGSKLTLTAVYNSTPGTFQWYRNNTSLSGSQNSSFQASTTGTYTVRYTDAYGCSATSTGTVVTVVALPPASYTISNQFDVCKDTVVTLTAVSGTGLAYQWQKANTNIPGAINRIYDTNATGTYRVIVTNTNNCSKIATGSAIPVVNLTATITASGSLSFCSGDSVVLTANSGTGYTYQWTKTNVNITGATLQSYSAKATGSYKVKITNSIGCTSLSLAKSVTVSMCSSRSGDAQNAVDNDELFIYPQPFSTNFTLHFNTEIADGNCSFEIYNTAGALVLQSSKILFNSNEAIVNAELLAPGIYFYKLISTEKVYNGRMVKE